MTTATKYTRDWLQRGRSQPMYDKNINRVVKSFFKDFDGPWENEVYDIFIEEFEQWLNNSTFNNLKGFDAFPRRDVCMGCTQFIDDLYMAHNLTGVMTFKNDYKYHWRLNNDIKYVTLENIAQLSLNNDGSRKPLLIALPFPAIGDIHIDMDEILKCCVELNIDVHIDGAWITCCRDITFNFDHPAIKSFAISLSKGLGLGWNRVAVRYSREHNEHNSICLMNDFSMNCKSLTWMGIHFIRNLAPDYFWKKYGDAYNKICQDFDLAPTKAIHIAMLQDGESVGTRPLLRFLADE